MKRHYKSGGYDSDMDSAIRGAGDSSHASGHGLGYGGKGHGTKYRGGKNSHSGGRPTTRGASVRSGLSDQRGFDQEAPIYTGNDNKSGRRNQVPCQPKHSLSTDRGDFTCW